MSVSTLLAPAVKPTAGIAAALLLLSGCGASAVSSSDVEDQVTEQLTQTVGEEPEGVECGEDLPAEEGASITCLLTTPDGQEFDTDVEVTSVADNEVSFDIRVADEPNG